MMAINVTQKDATLRELMDWLARTRKVCECNMESAFDTTDPTTSDAVNAATLKGAVMALNMVMRHCDGMLGYGGDMPLEVPNQSEDARQEAADA